MLLPTQACVRKAGAVMFGSLCRGRHIALGAEPYQRIAVSNRLGGIGQESEMQQAARRLDRREGAGVDFGENGLAVRMRHEAGLLVLDHVAPTPIRPLPMSVTLPQSPEPGQMGMVPQAGRGG